METDMMESGGKKDERNIDKKSLADDHCLVSVSQRVYPDRYGHGFDHRCLRLGEEG